MILQSLVRYYEIMAKDGKLPLPGYSTANVSLAINLSPDGTVQSIVTMKEPKTRGKKTVDVPQSMTVPEQVVRAVNVCPNFLCDNASYLLGIDSKGKPERTLECFSKSRKLHEAVLSGVHTETAQAVLNFFQHWEPQKAAEHPALLDKLEEILAGGNLIFILNGGNRAQDKPEIRNAWESYRKSQDSSSLKPCLVTGRIAPVARLHGKIKGVKGAQAVGANLVSFNSSAYESYGHDGEQGLNAPVSEYAVFAYTTALNYLLSSDDHRIQLGDTTVVYWAEGRQQECGNLFTATMNPQNEDQNNLLDSIMEKVKDSQPIADDVTLSTPFHILGLAPNAARISVRFYLHDTFGNFLNNIAQHYKDLEIAKPPFEFQYLTTYWLLQETVNPNSKDKKASDIMTGAVLRSILAKQPYPESLLNAVMLRIRAEQDDPDKHIQKISSGRAAIIKACLLRTSNNESYKEVLTVSLKTESKNRAYTLGRLFAVLEKAQQDANPDINTTIKDRYFTSACATPKIVFHTLFSLYQPHLEKIKKADSGKRKGYAINLDKLVRELMDKFEVDEDPFPARLDMDGQNLFILGYYHQVQDFYTPKNKDEKNEEE